MFKGEPLKHTDTSKEHYAVWMESIFQPGENVCNTLNTYNKKLIAKSISDSDRSQIQNIKQSNLSSLLF